MKSAIPVTLLLASCVSAFVLPTTDDSVFAALSGQSSKDAAATELRLIQLSPVETRWATEEEKLELKRQGLKFMDITDHQELGMTNAYNTAARAKKTVTFPAEVKFVDDVKPMLEKLDKDNMQENLEKFTSFHTRYARSDYGRQSSEWLLSRINSTATYPIPEITVKPFPHSWQQSSIIVRIPGKSNKTVVIGAHQDSINLFLPSILAAPGADDDGSGTVTILEALRVLVASLAESGKTLQNNVEFHWYSAEELGLLGSQAIFAQYEREGKDVVAMLQQDMTGFVQKTLDAGKPESVGVITDYVDSGLTEFIKIIIDKYCDIPYVETECGYACSDHASASKAGYPSAFVIESTFEDSDDHIHGTNDLIKYLSFDHMLQHAKMTLALAYELGNTDFEGKGYVEPGAGEL